MKTILVITATLLLSACSTTQVSQFNGPDAKPAYSIRCTDLGACYTRAGSLCKSGYSTIESKSGTVVLPVSTGFMAGQEYNMVISCKP